MTKQGKVRRGLIKLFTPPKDVTKSDLDGTIKQLTNGVVDEILSLLHSQGVVIKADVSWQCACELCDPDNTIVAVEPLIK